MIFFSSKNMGEKFFSVASEIRGYGASVAHMLCVIRMVTVQLILCSLKDVGQSYRLRTSYDTRTTHFSVKQKMIGFQSSHGMICSVQSRWQRAAKLCQGKKK